MSPFCSLQDHFALRLSSIKSQHEEAALRSDAIKQEQVEHAFLLTSQQTAAPPTPSARSRRSDTGMPMASPVQKQKQEKGWISVLAKPKGHNVVLTRLQKASTDALKVCMNTCDICHSAAQKRRVVFIIIVLTQRTWQPPKHKAREDTQKSREREMLKQQAETSLYSPARGAVGAYPWTQDRGYMGDTSFTSKGARSARKPNLDLLMETLGVTAGGGGNAAGVMPTSNGNDPDVAFNRFKVSIYISSVKWRQARGLPIDVNNPFGRTSQGDGDGMGRGQLGFQTPPGQGGGGDGLLHGDLQQMNDGDLHALSETMADQTMGNSMVTSAVMTEKARRAAIIRDEESRLMQYEDERRRMFLKEQSHQLPHMFTPSSMATPMQNASISGTGSVSSRSMGAASRTQPPLSSTTARFDPRFDNQPLGEESSPGGQEATSQPPSGPASSSPAQVEASFRWLAQLRPLVLSDRVPRTFHWRVVHGREKPTAPISYTLQWVEPALLDDYGAITRPEAVAGFVVLQEVKDIYQSGASLTLLNLVVGDSARAVRASGGRTIVVIECGSPGECAKYRLTLQTLRSA